jgi:hypothetical protein
MKFMMGRNKGQGVMKENHNNYPLFPKIDLPQLKNVDLPLVYHVKLRHPCKEALTNFREDILHELDKSKKIKELPKRSNIAIAVGSRGIAQIGQVITDIVSYLKAKGHNCFIIPAMGSHGGAKAETQAQILRDIGIEEVKIGAPIKSSMEVVDYGKTKYGVSCKFDKIAAESDAVIVVNRVKSHTSFSRSVESGLTKMVAVGLGKDEGARNVHKLGPKGLLEVLPELARIAIQKSPIMYGIALVENANENLCVIEGSEPDDFFSTDERLLKIAKQNLAKLPFDQIDVLIVEEIGKDISGMGMDYAVTGRTDIRGLLNPSKPFIHKIGVLSLTSASHGNGQGIGVADYIPLELTRQLNLYDMYMNSMTASVIEKTRIPIVLPDELSVIKACVATCWKLETKEVRFCMIRSTLHLDDILISEPLLKDIEMDTNVQTISSAKKLRFSQNGKLLTRCHKD